MKSVLKSATSQVGGLAKHAAKKIATMPFEVIQGNASSNSSHAQSEQSDVLEAMEQGSSPMTSSSHGDDYSGFDTKANFDRYVERSGDKDDMELAMTRKEMRAEFGFATDMEQGMQKARVEREEKAQKQEYVEEQETIPTMDLFEKKKDVEKAQVLAAKGQSSAEQGIGKKIVG